MLDYSNSITISLYRFIVILYLYHILFIQNYLSLKQYHKSSILHSSYVISKYNISYLNHLEQLKDARRRRNHKDNIYSMIIPIPIISVSLNIDSNNYLIRMLQSIDYPIELVVIQIGNSNHTIITQLIEAINHIHIELIYIHQIQIYQLDYNPGSAKGFNFGLSFFNVSISMQDTIYMYHKYIYDSYNSIHNDDRMRFFDKDYPWILIINNDIAFYPNILFNIATTTHKYLNHSISNSHLPYSHSILSSNRSESYNQTTNYGLGFTQLCCGGEWSAVIFLKPLIQAIGYFDENFYPAYYEDDDYGIRVHLSGFHAYRIPKSRLMHGTIDGSRDYESGLQKLLYQQSSVKNDKLLHNWRSQHEQGLVKSVQYIEKKWNIKMGSFQDKNKLNCKAMKGINLGISCTTGFSLPFNNTQSSLSDWVIDNNTLLRIQKEQ